MMTGNISCYLPITNLALSTAL